MEPEPGWTVADLESGTGLYTDNVALLVERVYAVDQHAAYREKSVPENVTLVTGNLARLPFGDGERDCDPAPANCFDLVTAQSMLLEAGFEIRRARERREPFAVVASRRE